MKKVFEKMGQNESKQKLQMIVSSLEKIRKDARTGKITANDVERIHGILQRYSNEIDVNLARKVRASDVYTAEQLIEITGKELDSLKQEVNLDLSSIPTNSFSRGSVKNSSKDKLKSVKNIVEVIEQIRQQIRNDQLKPEDYDRLQAELVAYSQKLSNVYKKNKKKEADQAQKLVSSVTTELLKKQQENSDSVSRRISTTSLPRKVEKESKKQETPSEEPKIDTQNTTGSLPRKNEKESVKKREALNIVTNNITGTLDDIETKLEALKSDVRTAENNKDKSRLHFLAKSIQTLMTDLQMVNVKNQIVNEERKALLEKNLVHLHQQIDKFKRQLSRESNINYLSELSKKEKIEKCLRNLDEIEKSVMTISRNLNLQNYESEKQSFNQYKNKLDSIEELSQEIGLKKSEVSDVILNVENAFTRIEMEERLNQAEWRHFQYKIDLDQFTETTDSNVYKKHRQFLEQLKEYVSKVLEINQKVDEKKKYILYNIDNNIVALEQKAKENKAKLKEYSEKEFVLRRDLTKFGTELLDICKEIPDNPTPELQSVLNEVKSLIEEKLKTVSNQSQRNGSDIQLVKVREKNIEPLTNSTPPIRNQLENIQKEIETLQIHIENSRYSKETQLYKDLKLKLDNYKIQVINLSRGSEDGGRFGENLLKYIDNVLLLLQNNMTSRRSTTEDILIDIMSVSTRVNDLGSKIQGFTYSARDYESFKESLLEHQQYLKNLKITPNRANLCKSRDDILKQIERYLTNLEDLKKNDNNNTGTEEEKRFNQELRKLKEKVSRYTGTYKNVLYKSIENELDKYLKNVDKVFKDTSVATKIKRDIENSKMILEQRSSKDPHYYSVKRDVRSPGSKELTEIRQNVESVKQELSQVRPLTKEELDKLDARLTLSILALDNIKDDNSSEEREKLYKEIHFHFARIQDLMLVSKPHSVLVEDLQQKELEQQQLAAKIIANIESDLEEIKPQISTFVGTETSPKFFQLDEILVRSTLKLDELSLDQTSELHHVKVKLMRDLQMYADMLDERIDQTEEIEKLEKEVKVMLMKIDSFNGYFGDAEYTYLDEEIIRLKVSLGTLHVNQDLIARREACIRDVDSCMKKLNEAAKTRTDAYAGTLV